MTETADVESASTGHPAFPMARKCPFSPPEEYARLRETEPISKVTLTQNGRTVWLLTKYEHVRAVLADPRMSADITADGYPLMIPVPIEILRSVPRALFHLDPPQHTVQRRLLMPEFTVRRVEAMRARTQEITDERISAILEHGGPVDLVAELALPIPSQAICELLGIPFEDRHFFHEYTAGIIGKNTDQDAILAREMEMAAYIDRLLDAREKEPGDDLISHLLMRNREPAFGVERGDIGILVRALIAGGHETTANMISLGVLALLANPDQLALVREDRALAARAVDEALRLFSISDFGTSRVATEDIELDGIVIRKGEGVIASMAAADHDPSVFADPGRFDIRREAAKHVAFGHGIHQCSGQSLVRMELEIVFTTLFDRIPGLRLAVPLEEVPMKTESLIHGLRELMVTW
ncbi:cytochrome P450 [Actinomadura sp. WMMA1423]|uniref:cytochrome P450 n=1 Tax=Actinomadura sp. WMMA1423 TaxID=2591108 RepID=UPI00114754B0|nr:cytochrome P450 [Actinomadura sp. WMMA1423]